MMSSRTPFGGDAIWITDTKDSDISLRYYAPNYDVIANPFGGDAIWITDTKDSNSSLRSYTTNYDVIYGFKKNGVQLHLNANILLLITKPDASGHKSCSYVFNIA